MLLLMIIPIFLNKYLSTNQKNVLVYSNLTILGIFLFHILWETRSRYLMICISMLLLSSFIGIISIVNFINKNIEGE